MSNAIVGVPLIISPDCKEETTIKLAYFIHSGFQEYYETCNIPPQSHVPEQLGVEGRSSWGRLDV